MTISKTILAAIAAFSLFICLESEAAIVLRSSSVFIEPSNQSSQVLILKESTRVHVSGNQLTNEGMTYLPIEVDGVRGWILKSALEIEPGDFEYYPVYHRPKNIDFWVSGGIADVDAAQSNMGGRLGMGIDIFPTRDGTFFFGALYSKPFSGETMDGTYTGDIHRSNFLLDIGYYFVPDALYLRGMGGWQVVNSSNFNIGTRVEPTFGAGLGFEFYKGERSNMAIEATYEYTERAVSSAFGIDTDFDQEFGDYDVSSIIPRANVFALNLVLNLTP
jgi:hypothetical protein